MSELRWWSVSTAPQPATPHCAGPCSTPDTSAPRSTPCAAGPPLVAKSWEVLATGAVSPTLPAPMPRSPAPPDPTRQHRAHPCADPAAAAAQAQRTRAGTGTTDDDHRRPRPDATGPIESPQHQFGTGGAGPGPRLVGLAMPLREVCEVERGVAVASGGGAPQPRLGLDMVAAYPHQDSEVVHAATWQLSAAPAARPALHQAPHAQPVARRVCKASAPRGLHRTHPRPLITAPHRSAMSAFRQRISAGLTR